MTDRSNHGPLADIRVLELGQLIAGPFCGQLLGDMGAEIIKLEPPGVGDAMRDWGRGVPVWWSVIARNKKSATLNLREPRGQQLLRDLVAHADILIENFRPGTMEKWGLGYAGLAAINRGLIMVRVSGFGQTGPYAERAGYGSVGEAMGGIRYIAGDPGSAAGARRAVDRRFARRDVCVRRRAGGAASSREHRRRPGGRFGDLRSGARDDGVDGAGVHGGRTHPRAQRRDPAEDRAVERVSDEERRDDRDGRESGFGIQPPVRRDAAHRTGARRALRRSRRARRESGRTRRVDLGVDRDARCRPAAAAAQRVRRAGRPHLSRARTCCRIRTLQRGVRSSTCRIRSSKI